MATVTGIVLSRHLTLTPNVADTLTFASDVAGIEIKNRGTDYLYVSYNATPTVAGNDTFVIGPGESLRIPANTVGDSVALISASATAYSVTGLQ